MSYTQEEEILADSLSETPAQARLDQERTGVPIEIGKLYLHGDRLVSLQEALIDGYVRVRDEVTGAESTIAPGNLRSRPADVDTSYCPPSSEISDFDKAQALKKLKHIQRLVRLPKYERPEAMLAVAALSASRTVRTIRSWLADYDAGGLRALAPLQRGRPKGSIGIDSRVEAIVLQVIRRELPKRPAITVKALVPWIERACDDLNKSLPIDKQIRYPGPATVGRRLRLERMNPDNHRGQTRRHIKEYHRATPGGVKAARPLERVEIDHALIDVHAVDDSTLESIGRCSACATQSKPGYGPLARRSRLAWWRIEAIASLPTAKPPFHVGRRHPRRDQIDDLFGVTHENSVSRFRRRASLQLRQRCCALGVSATGRIRAARIPQSFGRRLKQLGR